jgi:hypothetical protein
MAFNQSKLMACQPQNTVVVIFVVIVVEIVVVIDNGIVLHCDEQTRYISLLAPSHPKIAIFNPNKLMVAAIPIYHLFICNSPYQQPAIPKIVTRYLQLTMDFCCSATKNMPMLASNQVKLTRTTQCQCCTAIIKLVAYNKPDI